MPASDDFKIDGLKDIISKLKDVGDRVKDKDVDVVLMAAAQVVKEQAQANAPVDTGKLRDSIIATYGKRRGKDGVQDVVVMVKTDEDNGGAPYAYPVEYGRSDRPAQPFLRPAVQQKKGEVKEILTNGLKEILKDVVK